MFSDNVTNAWWFISLYLFLLIALTFVTFGKSCLLYTSPSPRDEYVIISYAVFCLKKKKKKKKEKIKQQINQETTKIKNNRNIKKNSL